MLMIWPTENAHGHAALNEFLQFRRREILQGTGTVSCEQMDCNILQEYAEYNARRLKFPEVDDTNILELPAKANE